ncbi:PIG-L family deacetylase [Marinicella sediminis]|uniref:PIG-L family deacetylase n=1 Tax=Marinicella sediminis TaxID=1792834 RepID=A0ABV7JJL5_9GAMM|nr:PIG-L family deacetylase [Marinicella sediminis]
MRKILLIDDDPMILEILQRWLHQGLGAVVHVEHEFSNARLAVETEHWDVVIVDVHLADGNGLELVKHIRDYQKNCRVLMISGQVTTQFSLDALNHKVDGFLQKPLKKDHFLAVVGDLYKTRKGLNVLAIGAHPDDVEIGCGGTLLRHDQEGDQVHVLTLSQGGQGGDTAQRNQESRRAALFMNASLMLGDLEDTRISEGPETIQVISRAINKFRPDVIYTHSPNDAHQDHRNVYQATLIAARGVPGLACYQSPSTNIHFRPSRFADISDYLELKQQLVQCFDSQTSKCRYLKPSLIAATAEYWGRFSGYGFIEPFEVIRSV